MNLLHKILNLVLNHKEFGYLLKQKKNLILKFCKINLYVYITVSLWKCPRHR